MLPDAMIELARKAADHRFVTRVSKAKAAAGEATEVFVGTDYDRGFSHFLRLDGGDDARGSAAVNDEVRLGGGWTHSRGTEAQRKEKKKKGIRGTWLELVGVERFLKVEKREPGDLIVGKHKAVAPYHRSVWGCNTNQDPC